MAGARRGVLPAAGADAIAAASAARTRALRLLDWQSDRPDNLSVEGGEGSRFTLDGVVVAGRGVQIEGGLASFVIRHATLVPGWSLQENCEPRRPAEPSIELINSNACIVIEHSIVGSIQVNNDEVMTDPVRIRVSDSILDATGADCEGTECEAIGAAGLARAHVTLRIARSTVIGRVMVHAIELAENSIFIGNVGVARRQIGCMRFCHVSPCSRTPKRFNCQPDRVQRAVAEQMREDARAAGLPPPSDADTCTRAQVVWQVKPLLLDNRDEFGCASVAGLVRPELPRLRARARRGTPSPEHCLVSPEAQYRGLENHLYRVEVHETGIKAKGSENRKARTAATFKWSRDNGSVVVPIVSLSGSAVIVASLGQDPCALLKPGDWVEIDDDQLALREQSGPLAQVEAVDREEMRVTLKWPNGVTDPPSYAEGETPDKHPLLRRWDHSGDPAAYGGALLIAESAAPDEGWIELEDGVQISFAEGGEYRVGDYWLIPARVATGDVEWPAQLDSEGVPVPGEPAALPPHGPTHHYAPLYYEGRGRTQNCRCTITPARNCPDR